MNRADAMRALDNSDRCAALRRAMLISVAAEHQPAAALSDKRNQPAELRNRNHRHLIQNNNRAGLGAALELQVGLEFLKGRFEVELNRRLLAQMPRHSAFATQCGPLYIPELQNAAFSAMVAVF